MSALLVTQFYSTEITLWLELISKCIVVVKGLLIN